VKKYLLICLLCLAFLVACGTEDFESKSSDKNSSIASSVTPNVNTNTASPFLPYEPYQPDSISVEKLLNDNPIDKAFISEEKKLNAQTTYDELQFVGKYIGIWEVEMNATLSKLRSKLTGTSLEELNKSQSAWVPYTENDVHLACDIQISTAEQGSGIPLLNAHKMLGRYRYRTLELAEYCYMITGDFKFEYN